MSWKEGKKILSSCQIIRRSIENGGGKNSRRASLGRCFMWDGSKHSSHSLSHSTWALAIRLGSDQSAHPSSGVHTVHQRMNGVGGDLPTRAVRTEECQECSLGPISQWSASRPNNSTPNLSRMGNILGWNCIGEHISIKDYRYNKAPMSLSVDDQQLTRPWWYDFMNDDKVNRPDGLKLLVNT